MYLNANVQCPSVQHNFWFQISNGMNGAKNSGPSFAYPPKVHCALVISFANRNWARYKFSWSFFRRSASSSFSVLSRRRLSSSCNAFSTTSFRNLAYLPCVNVFIFMHTYYIHTYCVCILVYACCRACWKGFWCTKESWKTRFVDQNHVQHTSTKGNFSIPDKVVNQATHTDIRNTCGTWMCGAAFSVAPAPEARGCCGPSETLSFVWPHPHQALRLHVHVRGRLYSSHHLSWWVEHSWGSVLCNRPVHTTSTTGRRCMQHAGTWALGCVSCRLACTTAFLVADFYTEMPLSTLWL